MEKRHIAVFATQDWQVNDIETICTPIQQDKFINCSFNFLILHCFAVFLRLAHTHTLPVDGMWTGMLDFDYMCKRKKPSVEAMIFPFSGCLPALILMRAAASRLNSCDN